MENMEHPPEKQDLVIIYAPEGDEELADQARTIIEDSLDALMRSLLAIKVSPAIIKTGPGSKVALAKYEESKATGPGLYLN